MSRLMRWAGLLALLLVLALSPPGGQAARADRLEPMLRLLLRADLPAPTRKGLAPLLPLAPPDEQTVITVLVQLEPSVKGQGWLPAQARLRAQAGPVAVVSLPVALLDALASAPGVRLVQADRRLTPHNDLSVPAINAPAVHSQGLRGRGVIVGIIDSGLDWTHPDFLDPQGQTRVRALLDLSDPGDLDGDGGLDGPVFGGTLYTPDQINPALADNGLALDGPGAPIPDLDPRGVELTVDVPVSTTIRSLAVTVRVRHTWRQEVRLDLVAPDGLVWPLLGETRGEGEEVYATVDLPLLVGQPAAGTWTLRAVDRGPRGRGEVEGWTLHLNQIVRATDRLGHGTHIAGTAAGGGRAAQQTEGAPSLAGVAPEADLVVVKAARHDTGFLASDIVAALAFVDQFAAQAGQPWVANLSMGDHSGPHDGAAPLEQAIDALTLGGQRGRAVVVAAGNDGQRDNHAAARLEPAVQTGFDFSLPPQGGLFLAYVWFGADDQIRVGVRGPSGEAGPSALPTDEALCWEVEQGGRAWLAFQDHRDLNGSREAVFLLSAPAASGRWSMTLANEGHTTARVDAWAALNETAWLTGVERARRVTTPGTARGAITVGAFVTRSAWSGRDGVDYAIDDPVGALASFSSDGPTRDGRLKPEIAAPGAVIVSSRSAWLPAAPSTLTVNDYYIVQQGTSMAAPHVAGAAALLLQADPNLTFEELRGLLMAGAGQDSLTGAVPNPRWGAGRLDVARALKQWRASRRLVVFLPLLLRER